MKDRILFTVLFLIVLFCSTIYSQWSNDPTVNNAVCTQASTQEYPTITDDGNGGAIIVWIDLRSGTNWDIYAQRININGVVQWATDGVPICTQTGNQSDPTIINDGSGGAIITWSDFRSGYKLDIYAQRIDPNGVALWTTDGVPVCIQDSRKEFPTITSDRKGGAIIAWDDTRNSNLDIYAQRINSTGEAIWATDGVPVCRQTDQQTKPSIIYDRYGGAFITWEDNRNINSDIFAQRIDSNGMALWDSLGVAVCTQTNDQYSPTITFDGNGGAIIAWTDIRGGIDTHWDIYDQRIDSTGGIVWATDGLAVYTQTYSQNAPAITSDLRGGAIITWHDTRPPGPLDIYAQRIDSTGVIKWATDGAPVCTEFHQQGDPAIISDFRGGAIITWYDLRNDGWSDIYASKITSDGVVPVELTTFTAISEKDNSLFLTWSTATEKNNLGFEIQRSGDKQNFVKIGFLNGFGTTSEKHSYTFSDTAPFAGKNFYRLKQIDLDGTVSYSQVIEAGMILPQEFSLSQNYPNPFNPATKIKYEIPIVEAGHAPSVLLKVYDVLGNEVVTLVNEMKQPGSYEVSFNPQQTTNHQQLTSGVYFYQLRAGSFVQTRKMIVLK